MIVLLAVGWASVFLSFVLFQIYRPAGAKPKAAWLTALELPESAFKNSATQLFLVSTFGLFFELLMIRWISSEITIFAYFKNFVLIACFLGFGLGAYLCRQPVNFAALFAPLIYFALLIDLPLPGLRLMVTRLTSLLGSSTEVDVWGVPILDHGAEAITGMVASMAIVVPLFCLLSLIFIPIGQVTARLLERADDGIKAYSINIAGSLLGILLYTGLCLIYQPPATWFLTAGLLLLLSFGAAPRIRLAGIATLGLCGGLALLPQADSPMHHLLGKDIEVGQVRTQWSPYQKLGWAASIYKGETVAYQLTTNDNWYQYVIDLSDKFINSHQELLRGVPPAWNSYNMPYHFYDRPPAVLVLGSGMGNDVAAALRNGAGRVTAVEIDPMILKLGRQLHFEHPYDDPRVTIVNNDARSYMQKSEDRFQVITFSLLDSHTTSSHFSNIRIDNYVYTREAMTAAKSLLAPDGVMVVKFQVNKPFIAGRLKATLKDVFGTEPVQFGVDQSFNISPGAFFVSGNQDRIRAAVEEPGLKRHIAEHQTIEAADAPVTTDDWPFFYQHAPGLPSSVIAISLILMVVCTQLMRRTAVPVTNVSWQFFFLGAGFMLMESQIVSRMALLFGTTWLVNSITISGLLLLIVLANVLERAGLRLPTAAAYSGLLVTIVAAYFTPVQALFSDSLTRQIGSAILALCGPVFFASIIFIRLFAAARFSGAALGSNLLGSLAGGLLESLSLWIGLRSLLLLAALLYGLSWLAQRKVRADAPQLETVRV